MRIGLLRDRIAIYKPVMTRDDAGQPVKDWEHVCDTWADILFTTGKESIKSERENYQPKASCRIRKRDVDMNMRVVFDGEIYDIVEKLPARTHIDLVIQKVAT